MAAEDAFVVAQPSTPASYFHLLRQHSLGEDHRPLIVFTPKSMLKRKEAASQPEDFTAGEFRAADRRRATPTRTRSTRCCSARGGSPGTSWSTGPSARTATVRDRPDRAALSAPDRGDPRVRRVVPEPQGDPLGAGRAAQHGPVAALRAQRVAGARSHVDPVTRGSSSSPSVGTQKRHVEEQKALLDRAFAPVSDGPAPTTDVYFTDRGLEELESAGVTRKSPWPGSPTDFRSSPTSTPSSRPRPSGSRPGWPGWTTRTTERASGTTGSRSRCTSCSSHGHP